MKSLRSSVKLHRLQSDVAKLPQISSEVIHILDVGTTVGNDLVELIAAVRQSSVVSRAVIREVNALATCSADTTTSVAGAVTELGRSRVMVVAVGSAIIGALDQVLSVYGRGRHQMWQRSVITAHVAELLVQMLATGATGATDVPDASDGVGSGCWTFVELPVAALLHDVGTVVLAGRMRERRVSRLRPSVTGLGSTERGLVGIDHAELGATIVEHWGLSCTLIEAIRFHHHPSKCSTRLAYGVVVASAVAEKVMSQELGSYSADAHGGANILGIDLGRLEDLARERLAQLGIKAGSDCLLTGVATNDNDRLFFQ